MRVQLLLPFLHYNIYSLRRWLEIRATRTSAGVGTFQFIPSNSSYLLLSLWLYDRFNIQLELTQLYINWSSVNSNSRLANAIWATLPITEWHCGTVRTHNQNCQPRDHNLSYKFKIQDYAKTRSLFDKNYNSEINIKIKCQLSQYNIYLTIIRTYIESKLSNITSVSNKYYNNKIKFMYMIDSDKTK